MEIWRGSPLGKETNNMPQAILTDKIWNPGCECPQCEEMKIAARRIASQRGDVAIIDWLDELEAALSTLKKLTDVE